MEPDKVVVRNNGRKLIVHWPDGRMDSLDAGRLWAECPSSRARRRRIDGEAAPAPDGLRITDVAAIGLYGVNIAFSDGHDRGIYPWRFLQALGAVPHPSSSEGDLA
jgi:DUF971 family protein